MKILSRLRALFSKSSFDAEMSEEMRLHVDQRAREHEDAGMSPTDARYAALRQFGGVEQVKEECREGRSGLWVENAIRDLRYAARGLWSSPGFSVVAIAVLAIGIGANATVFSVFNALLLRPLPVTEPERLFVVEARGPGGQHKPFPYPLFDPEGRNLPIPYPYFEQLRDQAASAGEVVAVSGWPLLRPCVLPGASGTTESVIVEEVSGNYFQVVGARVILGRALQPEDDRPGAAAAIAVVSHEFWQRKLAGAADVLGKALRLEGVFVTIVGIAPPHFTGAQVGSGPALWVPVNLSRQIDGNLPWGAGAVSSWDSPWIHILTRLRTGVTVEQAEVQFDAAYQHLLSRVDPRRVTPSKALTEQLQEMHLALVPARNGYGGVRQFYQKPATLLMALVGFIQLVACANIAGLLLARGAARQRELALRAALGASRGRLVRQLLTESVLLAGLAGVAGWLLAQAGTRLLGTAVAGVDIWADNRLLGFTALVTLGSGLLFGLLPAYRLSGRDLNQMVRDSGTVRRHRLNALLVVAQVALAFVLAVVAVLFGRSLFNLAHTDTGFQTRGRMLFDVNVSAGHGADQRFALYRRISDRIATVPGVASVAAYQGFSLLGDTAYVRGFTTDGYTPGTGEELNAHLGRIGPHFFATMGIPLLRGRDFDEHDTENVARGIRPIVISAWSAQRLFGTKEPIGRHIKMDADFEIVGVAAETKYDGVRSEQQFVFYVPLQHDPNEFRVTFAIETSEGARISAAALSEAIHGIDPEAQLSGLRTVAERLANAIAQDRLVARLAGFFGVLALLFSGLGLFGLMSYTVAARTKEFGVRMALGARPGSILRGVVRQGLVLGLLGCGLGALGGYGLTRLVNGLLFQLRGDDPWSFIIAGAGLIMVVMSAAAIPALRAAKVAPMVALRCE